MYWILVIMAAIAASLIALVVGGLVTPAEYRVVRRMHLQRRADDVRALLTDLAAYEQWAPSPTTIERQESRDAQTIALHVTDDDTESQLRWEWRVEGDDAHSVVTLTESGRVGNPVIRFFAALRGHGGNAERTLRALAEHYNEFGVSVERL
ncbi:hypothetical protein [Gemmatimonas groenlandica]|uniref:Polyketide cyclase n=1 Tax=Gemmatimonas groenlandica TaxID=2732249 RepID=A0A6M4IUE2_9BACT|nr:hypothetical protein [Gemmatimonas groenlandica]QJR37106.1 hypothetical protein HKW67_17070 [Gemmatimonas groenlandica]